MVFEFGRRPVKSRAEMFRSEVGESLGHLMRAATQVAGGVGATMGPRVTAAREQVTGNLVEVAGKAKPSNLTSIRKKKREREMARKRGFMLAGLLAAGAVVGAAGALVARRRRHQWEEYDATQPVDSTLDSAPTEPVAPTLESSRNTRA